MSAFRRVLTTLFAFASWGLALYLFYTGSVAAGLGALASVFVFSFGLGMGEAFANRFGYDAIKKAREEGYAKGRKKTA